MKDHFSFLKKKLYTRIPDFLAYCEMKDDPDRFQKYLFTGSGDRGLSSGVEYAGFVHYFITAYYLEDSPYYRDDTLLLLANEGLCQFESYLHEDGSLDLISTNFHDPAQTGFYTQIFFEPVELLVRFTHHTEIEDTLFETIKRILVKMGNAMANLGFHTPNHRWVISSGLALAYRYTGEERFLLAIEEFLREGIDCDEFGEYTERSTGSYNNICNHSFVLLALALERPDFLEYPRRNLKLMYHFTEPDDTVNTLNSSRWDNNGQFKLEPYYMYYLIMALIDNDPEFAYTADRLIEHDHLPDATFLPLLVSILTLHPALCERLKTLQGKAPEKDQTIFLPNSRIARVYRPEHALTMTLLATRGPVFFQMNYGAELLQVRFAGSFFGDPHSPFRAREILTLPDGFKLICEEKAGYRSRFAQAPETSNWRKMDHSKRQIINVQTFRTEICVHILDDGATLDIETFGCERIPTKLEITLKAGGRFFSDSVDMIPKEGDYLFLKNGNAEYFLDHYRSFSIEGGFCKHHSAEQMRGTSHVDPKKFTIAMTDVTPQKSSITIRAHHLLKP